MGVQSTRFRDRRGGSREILEAGRGEVELFTDADD
jgi:hypothetical protein